MNNKSEIVFYVIYKLTHIWRENVKAFILTLLLGDLSDTSSILDVIFVFWTLNINGCKAENSKD